MREEDPIRRDIFTLSGTFFHSRISPDTFKCVIKPSIYISHTLFHLISIQIDFKQSFNNKARESEERISEWAFAETHKN